MRSFLFVLAIFTLAPTAVLAEPMVGRAAPDFSVTDINAWPFQLSAQRGKVVVLEWTNGESPFVRHYYDTGVLLALQKAALDSGVVWVTINSEGVGKPGYISPSEVRDQSAKRGVTPSAFLIDYMGALAEMYGVAVTPQVFVIGKDGRIVYSGAIGSYASQDKAPPTEYLSAALRASLAGQGLRTPQTKPYGTPIQRFVRPAPPPP